MFLPFSIIIITVADMSASNETISNKEKTPMDTESNKLHTATKVFNIISHNVSGVCYWYTNCTIQCSWADIAWNVQKKCNQFPLITLLLTKWKLNSRKLAHVMMGIE